MNWLSILSVPATTMSAPDPRPYGSPLPPLELSDDAEPVVMMNDEAILRATPLGFARVSRRTSDNSTTFRHLPNLEECFRREEVGTTVILNGRVSPVRLLCCTSEERRQLIGEFYNSTGNWRMIK